MADPDRSRRVAEESREREWRGESFLRDLFLGRFRLDLVEPFPTEEPDRPVYRDFRAALERFLREEVDPVEIDRSGDYPTAVLDGLKLIGAFGMKIPAAYGGLGLTHSEYVRCMTLLGSYDGNITAVLSAHQAIGVPQPVKLFGSEELKQEYLPRCARGAISAFALTEPAVGSDPARLETVAELSPDGEHYILNGEKLWCTNGTLAEVIVVMARDSKSERINCFVVEMDWDGVRIDHRCHFMGLKALANAHISFVNVKVPLRNLVGEDGAGLKIALVTLNTGRLSLPAATAGTVKLCLEIVRKWGVARVQWGAPIGRHEAVTHMISDIAESAYAMESVAHLVGDMADRPDFDIRMEAAAGKEWNTVTGWRCLDQTLQIRGGRGYETEWSLADRGEPRIGVERLFRDSRINLIFEGSSEIMHLFLAREALDKHLEVAGALVDPKAPWKAKLAALPRVLGFYATWYPKCYAGWGHWPRYSEWGVLAPHVRWAARTARRLARAVFHAMVRYRSMLEKKQAVLFRLVDIGMEVFVATTALARARRLRQLDQNADSAEELARAVATGARRRVDEIFRRLRSNDDVQRYRTGVAVLEEEHVWLEAGTLGVPYSIQDMKPATVSEVLRAREDEAADPARSNRFADETRASRSADFEAR